MYIHKNTMPLFEDYLHQGLGTKILRAIRERAKIEYGRFLFGGQVFFVLIESPELYRLQCLDPERLKAFSELWNNVIGRIQDDQASTDKNSLGKSPTDNPVEQGNGDL